MSVFFHKRQSYKLPCRTSVYQYSVLGRPLPSWTNSGCLLLLVRRSCGNYNQDTKTYNNLQMSCSDFLILTTLVLSSNSQPSKKQDFSQPSVLKPPNHDLCKRSLIAIRQHYYSSSPNDSSRWAYTYSLNLFRRPRSNIRQ